MSPQTSIIGLIPERFTRGDERVTSPLVRHAKRQKEEGAEMDEPRNDKDSQFTQSQESFGVSLLRQARQKARELPPATEGQHPDTPLSDAASDALGHLIEHVIALPEDKQTEALTMIAYGMIMEHLRLATWMPRA